MKYLKLTLLLLISNYEELLPSKTVVFNGENCIIRGLKWIINQYYIIKSLLNENNYPINMSYEDEKKFQNQKNCWICDTEFVNNIIKVRDHDHLKKDNNFRGAACNNCNINCNFKYFKLRVLAHNAKNYDSHFIFQQIGLLKKGKDKEGNDIIKNIDINLIPLTDDKYISFEVKNCIFLDSRNFLSTPGSSLENLVECLNKAKDEKMIVLFRFFISIAIKYAI